MARIQSAEKKPQSKPRAPSARADKADLKAVESSAPKTRKNVAPFDRARRRVIRAATGFNKAAPYVIGLSQKLPEDHPYAAQVKSAAEGVEEITGWLKVVINQMSAIPEGADLPKFRSPRGSRMVITDLTKGQKVEIREKKRDMYEGLFEDGEEQVLTVLRVVQGGKLVACQTPNGLRQAFPPSHLVPINDGTQDDNEDEDGEEE